MKQFYLKIYKNSFTLLLIALSISAFSQTKQWTWISGSNLINQVGVYGTKGVADVANIPGARQRCSSWTDSNGDLWLFGGYGYNSIAFSGRLNDLWKYEVSNNTWTWVSGSNSINQPGVYGTMGIASALNMPGARYNSISWSDSNGDIWLFGGRAYDSNGDYGKINDLWKFDVSTGFWTWVSGSNLINQTGVYGTKGIASANNIPGARYSGSYWNDPSGNLWMLGGFGFDSGGSDGYLNDLWEFDVSTGLWTWVSGSNLINQTGVYGTKGIANNSNYPGSRISSYTWFDSNGDLYLFGGLGLSAYSNHGSLNDLWKFDMANNEWTWISGSDTINQPGIYSELGTPNISDIPGARDGGISWVDSNGNFILFGGSGYDINGDGGALNDIWEYNESTDIWTWTSGDSIRNQNGIYGMKGIPSASNNPGGKSEICSWIDTNGDLWLFGGMGFDSNGSYDCINDLWKYSYIPVNNQSTIGSWTWMSGSDSINQIGVYGTKGIANSSNIPGARTKGLTWTDTNGKLWLFGGHGLDSNGDNSTLNDLWEYDKSSGYWTWVSGSNIKQQSGVYGIKGVEDALNIPGARSYSISWIDTNNNLWLFGGFGYDINGAHGELNDLWKFNTSTYMWTWVSGNNTINQSGIYGTLGVEDITNMPGSREACISWIDANNKLWLFSGIGYDINGDHGSLNDLWSFDILSGSWTWVSGSNSIEQTGIYGTLGQSNSTNIPGARISSVSWIRSDTELWLFGGYGQDCNGNTGQLNDLWKYDISSGLWTWISGDSINNQSGSYGIQAVASQSNKPGGRNVSLSWKDLNGNFWLGSGFGYSGSSAGFLNDIWKFDNLLGMWIWVSGDTTVYQQGVYGTKGLESSSNIFGSRYSSSSWSDTDGSLWLFGGSGIDAYGNMGLLNDLWKHNAINTLYNISDTSICAGENTELTLSGSEGGAYYQLRLDSDNTIISTQIGTGNPISFTINPNSTTVYNIFVNDGLISSEIIDKGNVTVYPVPIANIISNSPVCEGDTLILNAEAQPLTCESNCNLPSGYCTSHPLFDTYHYIDLVEINGQVQNSSSSGYNDYSTTVFTQLYTGETYTIKIHVVSNFNLEHYNYAYIDWNRDGDFEDSNEVIYLGNGTGQILLDKLVTVPEGAILGKTIMRIVNSSDPSANSCGEYQKGETEDYMIEIKSYSTDTNISYAWSGPSSWSSTTKNNSLINSTNSIGGMYNLTVTDSLSCSSLSTVNIEVLNPQISFDGDSIYTEFPDTIMLDPGSFDSYLWNTGETNQFISYDYGNYNLTVAEGACVTSASVYIGDVQAIPLVQGWSLFSTYINTEDSLHLVMADVINDVIIVKNEIGNVIWPAFNLFQLKTTIGKSYLVKMSNTTTLYVYGNTLDPTVNPISLNTGYNHLGYIRRSIAPVEDMLNPIVNQMILIKNDYGLVYWPSVSVNVLGNMIPGEGYKINMSNQAILTYPANTINFAKAENNIPKPVYYNIPKSTGNDMTIGFPLEAWSDTPEYGDEIAVFDAMGNLVGSTVFTAENIALTIWGTDTQLQYKNGMADDEIMTFEIYHNARGTTESFSVTKWIKGDGKYHENSIAIVGKATINTGQTTLSIRNYPNPFTSYTEIYFSLPQKGMIHISLYNSTGKKVIDIANDIFPKNENIIKLDAGNLAPGNYFVKLQTNKETITKAIQIVK